MSAAPLYIHGTCVALGARALLLRGPSGAGKSDLAFRLVREDPGGETRLVADDQVAIREAGAVLLASAPAALAGLVELRGLGLVALPSAGETPLALIADLVARVSVPRIAEPRYETILGISLPVISLHAFDGTATAKLRLALETLPDAGFPKEDGRFGRQG
ncbi:MAG: aldolase [Alphaproteobacteria bacterium]|nr:aldolase [Alphaproteobacteria bacterium]MDX5416609.1 aldolase [Alphaproteobacteria bacterium]MDX5493973.1 aldolase [Alphaproteobacteria bacterium]